MVSEFELSEAQRFMLLPLEERERRLEAMSFQEAEALRYDWEFWSRPSQRVPGKVNPATEDGSWTVWMPWAGRGWGKTRTGAETVRGWVKEFPIVNLVGPTADDARDVMVEGQSGILAVCPKWERPTYRPSKRRLEWPNGARSLILTADEPDRARGKQSMKLWADEPGAWRYGLETWDNLEMGLRLGPSPQAVLTTTPKPTKLLKLLAQDPQTLISQRPTFENEANLSPRFLQRMRQRFEGTRLGRQELLAELLMDNPGALWKREWIDRDRVPRPPEVLVRIVVAVDPAVTSDPESDETGIIVAGMDNQPVPHFYVLRDLSGVLSAADWGTRAVKAYRDLKADRIVGEVNNGGDLVEFVIRSVSLGGKPVGRDAAYKKVSASRGKAIRAEPVAALAEQGRLHHVGEFGTLEDQLCDWDPQDETAKSPDRLDALVWAVTELMGGGMGGLSISDAAIKGTTRRSA